MSLDLQPDQFRGLLHQASDIVMRLYTGLSEKNVYHGKSPSDVRALFDEPLPRDPSDVGKILEKVEQDVFGGATLNISPHFYGYIMSGANLAGIVGEFLAVALNQNTGKWHLAASSVEMELRVIRWIAEFIGYTSDSTGVLVSGGSVANLTCLAVARRSKAPFDVATAGLCGGPPLTMYVSEEGHSSFDKSVEMLGLGRNQLRKIPVGADFTIDIEKLENQILEDKSSGCCPVCVIGNAGTVNTGAVDRLDVLADICSKYNLWFHVDAAYGGPAAGIPGARELFKGIDRADSIALDPHKWFYVPFEAGCVLVRDSVELRRTFSMIPDYLRSDAEGSGRFDFMEYNFQLSRDFKALKVWMTFKAYGAEVLRTAIQENIDTMRHLAALIDQSSDFERLAPAPLSIVCFRYRTDDARYHQDDEYLSLVNGKLLEGAEKDGRTFISGTKIQGRTALRACCVNHRTQTRDVEYLLNVLREIGSGIHEKLQKNG